MSSSNTAIRQYENTPMRTSIRHQLKVIEGGLSKKTACTHSKTGHALDRHDFVIGLVVVMAIVAFMLSLSAQDAQARSRINDVIMNAPFETITVYSGDTLWTIAENHHVSGYSTEEIVNAIRETNELESACLYCGMELQVPVAG